MHFMPMSARRLSAGFLCLAVTAAVTCPARSGPDSIPVPDNEKPVILPEMQVRSTLLPKPVEPWSYAQVDDLAVLSNASDGATRRLLADFITFRRASRLIWPAATLKGPASTNIILCGSGNRFEAFRPASPGVSRDTLTPSLFFRDREQVVLIADIETARVDLDPALVNSATTSLGQYEVDHFRQLYRQYIRSLLNQTDAPPPAWLEEGLAQLVMDVELTDTKLIYGKIDTDKGNGDIYTADADSDPTVNNDVVVGERPFNVVLQHSRLIPLEQFFAVQRDSPTAQNALGNTLWAKQAYAFVHFCLFGENLRHREAIVQFVQRTAHQPATEALFKECFKTDYAGMLKELRAYIRYTKHHYQEYLLQPADQLNEKAIVLRDASAGDVGLIKGDALRLAGQLKAAHLEYLIAYGHGAREAALLAELGRAEAAMGQTDHARNHLAAALKAGVSRPSAYVAQASLLLADSRKAGHGPLSPTQVGAVLAPLFAARQRPPALPEVYELIAETWTSSATPPKPEHLAVLDEGIRLFPRASNLLLTAARLNQQIGQTKHAQDIVRLGLRFPADADAKTRFESLLATLATER